MKKFFTFTVALVFSSLILRTGLKAQNLDETINNLSQTAASAYLQPVVSAFGSNLNSGWFDEVPSASILGFEFQIKFIGSASFFSDNSKTFSTTGSFHFTSQQADAILTNSGYSTNDPAYSQLKQHLLSKDYQVEFSGPTIVGSNQEHLKIDFKGDNYNGKQIAAYTVDLNQVKGLLNNFSALPSAAVQVNVGTVWGTRASVRWLPSITLGDAGKFSLFGFGIMNNPGLLLNVPLPIDFAVGFFTQKLTLGNAITSKATQFGIFASKTFGIGVSVTPYVGFTKESSTTTVNYNYTFDGPTGPQTTNLNFDLTGDNSTAITIGASFRLFVLHLAVDYKLAKTKTATASLFFGF